MSYLKEAEWTDMKIAIDGKTITGIRGITYKKTPDDEALHAAGREPVSIQSGNNTYEGTLKLLKNELDALNAAARALGYDDICDVSGLVITIAYLPKAARLLKTDTLTGVKLGELPFGWEQGAKFMEHDIPFKFLSKKSA
jgi:hypothetical protein